MSTSLRYTLLSHLDAAEAAFDRAKARWSDERTPELLAYRGYATDTCVYLKGRVLEDRGLTSDEPTDRRIENALNILRRMESDEIAGARVRVDVAGQSVEVVTNAEGYFNVALPLSKPLPETQTLHPVQLTLLGTPRQPDVRISCEAEVMTVPTGTQFGVISDIDDTVLQTGATSLGKMLTTTLLSNAHTRLPFEGVAAFYRALAYGTGTTADNPVFFVSSSPWNLYDMLVEFMDVQAIPRGPLFLRDLGYSPEQSAPPGHRTHKLAALHQILSAYPNLPFVLLGDSGQHDPEIYAEALRTYPGRFLAVYIRDVTPDERDASVRALAASVEDQRVALCYAEDSLEAAKHAAAHGLIDPARLPDIAAEHAKDEA